MRENRDHRFTYFQNKLGLPFNFLKIYSHKYFLKINQRFSNENPAEQ